MIEDPLYLSKDTRVFVIFDPEDIDDVEAKNTIVNEFNVWGYTCSAQHLLSVETINNSDTELGFESINASSQYLSALEIRQWYTFINILRKARILNRHFMVVFPGIGRFARDFPKIYEQRPMSVFALGKGVCISPRKATELIDIILKKDNIPFSVKQYLRLRMKVTNPDEEENSL